jgi:hypothetical protein
MQLLNPSQLFILLFNCFSCWLATIEQEFLLELKNKFDSVFNKQQHDKQTLQPSLLQGLTSNRVEELIILGYDTTSLGNQIPL